MTTANTLVLYARGVPRLKRALSETVVRLLGLSPEEMPSAWRTTRYYHYLLGDEYAALSYMVDWQHAFRTSPRLQVRACNINNLLDLADCLRKLPEFELVIILHSAAGDSLSMLQYALGPLQRRRGKLLVFFGNEYTRMPEKIHFAKAVEADFIATQLPDQAGRWLYAECAQSRLLPAPAALNPDLYHPSSQPRHLDIGFRGDLYNDALLGDTERTQILRYFMESGPKMGLSVDFAFSRLVREDWSAFLNKCKGIPGAESGTYYLERDDRTQRSVREHLRRYPDTPLEEILDVFYRSNPSPVSGKAISSRHLEPIGTRTCQILVRGNYNGILIENEHYLSVERDLSNASEVIDAFKDPAVRERITNSAYTHVLSQHTYSHRVNHLLDVILGA